MTSLTRSRSVTSRPRFLQGVFPFEGRGLQAPALLDPRLVYSVPRDVEAQLVYFRGGNASDTLVYAVIMRDGEPMRWFPIGAQDGTHVALRVVEDLLAETTIEVHLGAPEGASGQVVVDLGLVEV
jgi:assimilatory nitrate reductase catalytic subunit